MNAELREKLQQAGATAKPVERSGSIKTRCRSCNCLFPQSGHYNSATLVAQRKELMAADPELGKLCRECLPEAYKVFAAARPKPEPKPEPEAGDSDLPF